MYRVLPGSHFLMADGKTQRKKGRRPIEQTILSSARHLNKLLGRKRVNCSQGFKTISLVAEVVHGVHEFGDSPNVTTIEEFKLLTQQHKCLLAMVPLFSEVTKYCTSL